MLDSFHKYPLFPDLLENQRRSIKFFWEKGILDELELFSTIIGYKKEKTGSLTLVEQKNLKKKQTEGGVSPGSLSFSRVKALSTLSPKRILNHKATSKGALYSQPEAFGQKNKNFKLMSQGNGKKISGTQTSTSAKTFKKVFQQIASGDPNVFKTSSLHSKLQWSIGRNFTDLRSPEHLEKDNKIFKKTPSLSFRVKEKSDCENPYFKKPKKDSQISEKRDHENLNSKEKIFKFAGNTVFQANNRSDLSKARKSSNLLSGLFTNQNPPEHEIKTSVFRVPGSPTFYSPPFLLKLKVGRLGFPGLRSKQNASVLALPQGLSKQRVNPIELVSKENDSEYLVLHGSKFVVKAPYYSQSDSIKFQKTYSVGLFLPVSRKNIVKERTPITKPAKTLVQQDVSEKERIIPQLTNIEGNHQLAARYLRSSNNLKNDKKFWFYFGDIPLMTERGSFIINGAPRVLVNQIIRCPSVYFKIKLDHKNRRTYIASFLSEYGSWLRLETDRLSNRLWARIDKSPRFPADLLLMGLGYHHQNLNKRGVGGKVQSPQSFPDTFGQKENLSWKNESKKQNIEKITNNFQKEVKNRSETINKQKHFQFTNWPEASVEERKTVGTSVLKGGGPISAALLKTKHLYGRKANFQINTQSGFSKAPIFRLDSQLKKSENLGNTIKLEKLDENDGNAGLALQTIWKKCNPGRWTSSLGCYSFFYNKFLNPKRYSIGRVGRLRLNKRLLRNPECSVPTLTPEDILLAFNYLRKLRSSDSLGNTKSIFELDDIDHLKNRRVRLPGEILQNQFRLALSRITYSALRFQTETQGPDSKKKVKIQKGGGRGSPTFQDLAETISPRPDTFDHAVKQSFEKKFSKEKEAQKALENVEVYSDSSPTELKSIKPPPRERVLRATSRQFSSGGGTPPSIPAFQNTLRELFNTGQLSQYMDQTNPLAEITHKRRLSSLGPGGVGRDQAGFAVREIHPSHFGRICPIETPEGQNAGLVGSLASYARINADGFLQSPGIPIEENGFISSFSEKNISHATSGFYTPGRQKISLFSSELEDEIYVCTADTLNPIFSQKIDWQLPEIFNSENGKRTQTKFGFNDSIPANPVAPFPHFFPVRYKQEFLNIKGTDALALTYGPTKLFTGICPIQLISLATSLIPFLEHDDANRALMGSNMQRQAVPFMMTEKPFVGTGLELQAARDSSTLLLAQESGQVVFIDANLIQIEGEGRGAPLFPHGVSNGQKGGQKSNKKEISSYHLTNFVPSNQSTSLKQRPSVHLGDWVEKGFLLADGSATKDGEVTLGKNVLLAYMPWEGYNFEDAIVINERLVFEDIYTSIHVERFEVDVKNTKILLLRTTDHETPFSDTPFQESEEQNISSPTHSPIFSRLSPGEYLTSDLDILMLRVDGQQLTKNRSGNPKNSDGFRSTLPMNTPNDTESPNSDSFERPASLRHLDNRGIVKPGSWVQEGDILVGKVQIGQKEAAGNVGLSPLRTELPHEINQYVGVSPDKNGNAQPPVRNLPFPEYRLLLAIFDLQNNRTPSTAELQNRADKKDYLLSAEKKLLENELGISRGNLFHKSEKIGGDHRPPPETFGQEKTSLFYENGVDHDVGIRNESTKLENSSVGTGSIQANYPIKNTSVKVGIGVKGRVLECILDGELIQYGKSKENFHETPRKGETAVGNNRLKTGLAREKNLLTETCSSISIFLAHKKRIQLGDKMSGRHGNKGIVSLILPPQDMPYLQDGKAVDVVLNPLGVPSRMNVGQVLETLFGLSAFYYKKIYRIMPFDERINPTQNRETELETPSPGFLKQAENISGQKVETSRSLVYGHLKKLRTQIQTGIAIPDGEFGFQYPTEVKIVKGNQLNWLFDPNNPGKTQLFDGRTGEIFYQPVLVGYSYMFKLIHLVDDKIHARSTGPYSLVTQQPLGGRSKKGGQRLGEMEVWALQGFGTASILQEFLTVKSDEIYSRNHFLFHLMRRNWDSLDRIPPLKRFEKDLSKNLKSSLGDATQTTNWSLHSVDSGKQSRINETTASIHSKLPESFRVLINELHALCLSVYSNLPN